MLCSGFAGPMGACHGGQAHRRVHQPQVGAIFITCQEKTPRPKAAKSENGPRNLSAERDIPESSGVAMAACGDAPPFCGWVLRLLEEPSTTPTAAL